jgi:hypothetical protein
MKISSFKLDWDEGSKMFLARTKQMIPFGSRAVESTLEIAGAPQFIIPEDPLASG